MTVDTILRPPGCGRAGLQWPTANIAKHRSIPSWPFCGTCPIPDTSWVQSITAQSTSSPPSTTQVSATTSVSVTVTYTALRYSEFHQGRSTDLKFFVRQGTLLL
jgi:hypothetical protein